MKIKNLILAIREQSFRSFFITGNAWGLFHKKSHQRLDTGKEKVAYSSKESAAKAAASMEKKFGGSFSPYKCAFCDGYHVGKNKVF